MPVSRLDQVYRSMVMSKFFSKGWGKPENLKRLFEFRKIMSKRDSCYELVPKDYPVNIVKKEEWSDCRLLEGQFHSPFAKHLPGLVPNEAETVYFQMLLPKKWRNDLKPVCIHLAGTGDHYFWRRRNLMAKPLLKEAGIGSIIVENPFYGLRKPKDQVRSNLHNVSDIFVMGGCLILESLVLFHWCEKLGFGPLGITGISMGGHMASLAATSWPKPLVLVPCLSWSTASGVFTQGVLSGAINWDMLMDQYYSNGKYREEIKKLLYFPEEVFKAGQHFAQTFPESMDRIEELSSEVNLRTKSVNNSGGITSHGLSVERAASEAMLMGVGRNPFVEQRQAHVVSETFDVKDEGYALKEQRMDVGSHRVLDKEQVREEVNLMRAAGGGGGRTVALENVQRESVMEGEKMEPHQEGSEEKVKSTTRNVLDILSPSKLINTKSILAGFHESKSNLLRRNGKSAAAQSPPAKDDSEKKEALQFMRGIMDECTHLKNFDVPVDPDLIIAVTAKDDGYVPQEGVTDLRDIWPGIEVRNLDAGHVSAYVLYQHTFREAIKDAFERAARKYYSIDNLKS
ncbi:protein ABHD18 isoform X2 [Ischnura elegans]|uniref:protein ABHD18 isoform X2 n=1 Tax=Ischnura elegans TaxID=197161 RepID=UPI001ED89760|nr:protein ABHD18 isoform X2 [Ischnura elegans]